MGCNHYVKYDIRHAYLTNMIFFFPIGHYESFESPLSLLRCVGKTQLLITETHYQLCVPLTMLVLIESFKVNNQK